MSFQTHKRKQYNKEIKYITEEKRNKNKERTKGKKNKHQKMFIILVLLFVFFFVSCVDSSIICVIVTRSILVPVTFEFGECAGCLARLPFDSELIG